MPTAYEIRLGAHLDDHWTAHFDECTFGHDADGTTVLRCRVRDQAELHGLLARVRDLGIHLVSVTQETHLDQLI